AAGAARAVAEIGRDDQRPRAADLHPGNTLIPAADHLPGAELERKRLTVVLRAVELLAVAVGGLRVVQPPGVVNAHGLAGRRRRAGADLAVRDLQAGDVIHKPLIVP